MSGSGRQTVLLVASILIGGVVIAFGATTWLSGVGRPEPSSSDVPAASFPARAGSMAVVLVPAAIQSRVDGDAADLAVAGWFQQPFPFSCPAPLLPQVPVIEGCGSFAGWLLAQPESVVHHRGNTMWTSPATGPSLDIVLDGPNSNWARPLPPDGDAIPTAVVFVGHFHDARAAGCQPADRQECDSEFVVTTVAWANGVDNP